MSKSIANLRHSSAGSVRSAVAMLIAALSAAATQTALADATASDTTLEQVLVTGTRLSDVAAQLPAATTIIDEDTIKLRAPNTLIDLLKTVPGVQLVQPGGGAGIASFYMRGCEPNYTLFLVDGVKVTDSNDSRGGSFDLSTVSPGEIERVEVIRGPQSAVHGADALCGVFNVITKSRSEKWRTVANVSAGLDNAYDSGVELSGPLMAKGGVSLRASTGDQGSTVPGATFGTSSFNGKLTFDNDTGWRVVVHGRRADDHGRTFPDQSGGPELAVSRLQDVRKSRETSFDAEGMVKASEMATINASASHYKHEVEFASPAIVFRNPASPSGFGIAIPGRGENSELSRVYGLLDAVFQLHDDVRATIGADYMRESADLGGYLELFPGFRLPDGYQQTRHVSAAFAELQYSGFKGVTLLGSIRRDKPSTFDAHSTARAGVVYTPDEGDTEMRVYWGQGFKLPSLWTLGNALVGNADLQPEKSRSAEVGISHWMHEHRLLVGIAAFDNQMRNIIDFDNDLFQFVNRREVQSRGAELEVRYLPSEAWHFKGQVTYVQIDPKESPIPLRQRPKWRGSFEASWLPTSQWSLYATWLSVGKTYDFAIPTGGIMLGGYSRLDLNADWHPNERLSIGLAVDNVFDKRYSESVGFLTPGIQPRLSLRYAF